MAKKGISPVEILLHCQRILILARGSRPCPEQKYVLLSWLQSAIGPKDPAIGESLSGLEDTNLILKTSYSKQCGMPG
jgi:hypothetical protein